MLLLDRRNHERLVGDVLDHFGRGRFAGQIGFLLVDLVELGSELLVPRLEIGFDAPVLLRFEIANGLLALHDQSQCHCLHTSGRQPRLDGFPEQRARLVANEPVENAPSLLRLDFLIVYGDRIGNCLAHGVLGDLVEEDALYAGAVPQLIGHMPRNGFAFPVRIRGEQHR